MPKSYCRRRQQAAATHTLSLPTRLLAGDAESVDTRWGPLTVTVCGERGRTPCLTLHDVGLNHRSCFQSLLLAAGPKSLLSKNFCFYHVDAPGCQVGA